MRFKKRLSCFAFLTLVCSAEVFAAITVPMYLTQSNGSSQSIGTITLMEYKHCGVIVKPNLHDLTPGTHGFHIHENPSCDEKGMAAGGHFDPTTTKMHNGPYEDQSHLGDMPILVVDSNGKASLPVLAPRMELARLKGHAIMIHAGGDNYKDQPEKLGGGGARIACGVIPANE